jgi:hypothetical protein
MPAQWKVDPTSGECSVYSSCTNTSLMVVTHEPFGCVDLIHRATHTDMENTGNRLRREENINREELIAMGAKTQLIMFMTGPGGAGKSAVINALLSYCSEFSKNLGAHFDKRTIIVTALTGVAATSIMGETTSKAVGLTMRKFDYEFIKTFVNSRMILIDEISFCQAKELEQLDRSLKHVKEEPNLTFGGVHVIFCGDFHQLPPVGPRGCIIWEHERLLWHSVLNSFVELRGTWRFLDDPEWGEILGRFRMSTQTQEDINVVNQRVIKDK